MRYKTSIPIAFALAAVLLLSANASRAQEYGNYVTVRGLEGKGFLQPADDGQLQALVMNLPIMDGDTIWTEENGRIDLLMQDGNHLFLDSSTRVEMDRVPSDNSKDGRAMRVRLWKGSLLLDMRNWVPTMTSYWVTTPSASVSPSKAGLYLLAVENVDRTRVSCLEGGCVVASAGASVTLGLKQMTYAEYGYAPMAPMAAGVLPAGLMGFRDAGMQRRNPSGVSSQYLPPNLSAYSDDLDDNGTWNYDSTYGYVWRPTDVAADWSPYTYGQWDYNPWGMTWVPYETWGWAPYHYGRWAFEAGLGWGWCPMPYFAPAWCSFWWGDAGWFGWCPMDYWGAPNWGPCGWNSCGWNNIYAGNMYNNIIHHREAPPPNPIYPRAQGSPASLNGSGPRGAGGGLNLPPQTVRDLRNGRVTASEVRSRLTDPIATNRRTYPSIQNSDRNRTSGGISSDPSQRDNRGTEATRGRGITRDISPATRGTGATGTRGIQSGNGDPASRGTRATAQPPATRNNNTLGRGTSSQSGDTTPRSTRAPSAYPSIRQPLPDGGSSSYYNSSRAPRSTTPRQPLSPSYGSRDGGNSSSYNPRSQRSLPPQSGGSTYRPQTQQRPAPYSQPRWSSPGQSPQSSSPRYIPSRPSVGSGSGGGYHSSPAPSGRSYSAPSGHSGYSGSSGHSGSSGRSGGSSSGGSHRR